MHLVFHQAHPKKGICPLAVAPPWEPIAGVTKGFAPFSVKSDASCATDPDSDSIPRLPTPMAIRIPGLMDRLVSILKN
jgi:hypothetical protein